MVSASALHFYLGEFAFRDRYYQEGHGLYLRPNLEVYAGEFRNNYKQGKGLQVSGRGDIYEG